MHHNSLLIWRIIYNFSGLPHWYGPLTRYVKSRFAHAPGMPGTFSPPPRVSNPDMHHGTCVTHVPWCMTGSLTSGFLWSRWQGKRSRIPGACATRNFTYLVRGPLGRSYDCPGASEVILKDMAEISRQNTKTNIKHGRAHNSCELLLQSHRTEFSRNCFEIRML